MFSPPLGPLIAGSIDLLALLVSLTGNRLSLFVDHLRGDGAAFEGGVAVRKAPTLFLLLLNGRRGFSSCLDKQFQRFGHWPLSPSSTVYSKHN
jgi:hypothetical protein